MNIFSKKINLVSKTAISIMAVCILICVFIPTIKVNAVYPPLEIIKTVDNIFPALGEEITYTIIYKNNTSKDLTNVVIKDPLTNQNQNYLTFISASPAPTSGNDTWTISSLDAYESSQITLKAKISNSIPGWASEIKNRATIQSDQTSLRRSNNASVFIAIRNLSGDDDSYVGGNIYGSKLTIEKTARNITRGYGYTYSYFSSGTEVVYAEPGDEIEFIIRIKGPKNEEIDSVRLNDKLPPKLTYISDSTTVDGNYEPDGIISKYIYVGDVYPYTYREIKFRVKIYSASKFNVYPIDLVNIAYAWGSNGEKIKDTVKIIVREPTNSGTDSNTGSGQGSILLGPGLIAGQTFLIDKYATQETRETVNEAEEESEQEEKPEEEVKGAADVKVGANLIGLLILIILSCFIAFIIYCRVREDKLPKLLAKFYFKLKLFSTITAKRFKKVYW